MLGALSTNSTALKHSAMAMRTATTSHTVQIDVLC